jgi:hypothetical protein
MRNAKFTPAEARAPRVVVETPVLEVSTPAPAPVAAPAKKVAAKTAPAKKTRKG